MHARFVNLGGAERVPDAFLAQRKPTSDAAGDETAIAAFPELVTTICEVDEALNKKGVITGSAKAKKTKAQREAAPPPKAKKTKK